IESSQSHAAEELQLVRASEQEQASRAKASEGRAKVLNDEVAVQEEVVERVRGQLEQLEARSAADEVRELRLESEESKARAAEQDFRERIDLLSSELLQSTSEVRDAAAEASRRSSLLKATLQKSCSLCGLLSRRQASRAKAAEDRAKVLHDEVAAREEVVERVRGQLEQLETRSAADKAQ
ncbi:unnamed protein product, partial [Effrenium voratum]